MNHQVDVHPEDLIDREQDGTLSADERRRLEEHSAKCIPCALVRSAAIDFALERAPSDSDDLLLRSLLGRALGPTETAPPLVPPSTPPASPPAELLRTATRSRRRRSPWAVAAVVMFAATGATASFLSVRRIAFQHDMAGVPENASVAVLEAPKPIARTRRVVREAPALPEPVVLAAPIAAPEPIKAAPPPRTKIPDEVAPALPVPQPLTASQVFANANDARRRGDSAEALRLYQDLQQQFPGTREEKTSRVLLARLLLDRGEDAGRALSLFSRYLQESPNGTLDEEARLGRALALKRLGRPAEERQAWQQLLAAHPNSIHAERAKKRLDELR